MISSRKKRKNMGKLSKRDRMVKNSGILSGLPKNGMKQCKFYSTCSSRENIAYSLLLFRVGNTYFHGRAVIANLAFLDSK